MKKMLPLMLVLFIGSGIALTVQMAKGQPVISSSTSSSTNRS